MPAATHNKQLAALHALSSRLALEAAGGVLADSLGILLGATDADAAAAYTGSPSCQLVADEGLADGEPSAPLRRALLAVAQYCLKTRRPELLARDSAKHSRVDLRPLWQLGHQARNGEPPQKKRGKPRGL
jgi:hypothetical protein